MAMSKEDIANIFPQMVERFDASKADGVDATIQFDLSGDSGGLYWLRINGSGAEAGQGAIDAARMTILASADDFGAMMTGGLNPMQAFMTGKIKIKGDTGLALKLMPLING
ncbi:MAG: SCP2 sterol-binding domain-containing protein [Chloroflexota bacterium]|nr:SCP2 sterol-binding domain-containing protein [Chloroflexota bacterium]